MNRNKNEELKAKLTFVLIMFVFGTIGMLRRYIPLPSSVVAMARGFIGVIALVATIYLKGSRLDFKVRKKSIGILIMTGIFIGIEWVFLFESYAYTSVAVATLCYYMAPIVVIILSPFILKEKMTWVKILCVVLGLLGMALVSGVFRTKGIQLSELKGIAYGLAAALLYGFVVLGNKKLSDVGAKERTSVQLLLASLITVPYVLWTVDIRTLSIDRRGLIILLILSIFHTGLAYLLYFDSMMKLDSQKVAIFSFIDPVVAILLSALVLKEPLTMEVMGGIVLILGATFMSSMVKEK